MKQLCMPRKELICFTGRKKTIFSLDLQQNHHKGAPKKIHENTFPSSF